MKIVLVNYHYFIHGGPDRYFFNIKELLEREGHTVIPFCFDYEETFATPHRRFFPEPVSGRGTFLIENLRLSLKQKVTYVRKMFSNPDVESKFTQLLRQEQPDLVYSIYLSSSMLPKILHIARKKFGVPVVYRLSDFHMFCPSYLFYRDGNVCTECLTSLTSAVRNKCVQASPLASLLRVLQIKMIRQRGWYDSVDAFVCPSRIMEKFLIDGGVPRRKVMSLPTFTQDLQAEDATAAQPHFLYFGKITREKGVEVLIKAYNLLKDPAYRLRLIGHCSEEYHPYLLGLLDDRHRAMVTISAPLQGADMWQALQESGIVVQPAIWLENMPNTLIEALSAGKPVIASAIGSLTELVEDGENGILVPPGDSEALSRAMTAMSTHADLAAMGKMARLRFEAQHREDVHLERLLKIFESCRQQPH